LKKRYPLINLKRYLTIDELISALNNGKINAFINESLQISRYVTQSSQRDLFKLADFELTNDVHPVWQQTISCCKIFYAKVLQISQHKNSFH
jgi:ABC-type amino acid transport substrate-binding protein